ncbi:TetR/AcrR family transcriptional regulator [Actinoplanes sp. TRM 88003]|uniref:TetR/AcrR family transcriptional regulator n=1 Tax=Paractinoplanes aksuensis TaxID=2939490 RepID=A0ABT1DY93_9ACTN|nr:TetR/AcrR family transcriptional regulator [Actinoplanes aksuensis]MCO8275563.1 TetR/AcrR family transcriptional regulator [Actinoplanes aksuensis]
MASPSRPERRTRSDGERSRLAILDAAVALTTVLGLEGLSIGRLADHVGISKSGLYAHFGSKEELQLATIRTAELAHRRDVVNPAFARPDPLSRLRSLCENFLDHLKDDLLPGGCFFVSVNAEFDARPGAVHDRLAELHTAWLQVLEEQYAAAQAAGLLSPKTPPDQAVFELNAYLHMANNMYVLYRDADYLELARRSVANRLGMLSSTRSRPVTEASH